MCTVTYFPRPDGFILTHNRDEAPSRSPQIIVREKTPGGNTLIFPRDTMAGGTWISSSRKGWTACLLNGAFALHTRQLPYRRSRGLILLDFFDWENPESFFQEYDLDRVEPFTFLLFDRSQYQLSESSKLSESSFPIQVFEFRWDGQQRFLKHLPADQPHFWCSATLYPAEMQVRRKQVFTDWLSNLPDIALAKEGHQSPITSHQSPITNNQSPITNNQSPSPRSLLTLHRTGSIGDPENDFVMNRAGRVQTVSITQIIVDEKNAHMRYLDLLGGKRSERRLIHNKRRPITVNR